jgi:hypothetical protein
MDDLPFYVISIAVPIGIEHESRGCPGLNEGKRPVEATQHR